MGEPIPTPGSPTGLRASARHPCLEARGVVRFLYTNNPFYVISACLVFAGLRNSFDAGSATFAPLAVMAALAGFTLLLAVTAWAVVRFGNVWQDARSLLLLVVLMLLALSITFDDALVTDYATGAACLGGGLAFAVAVSEGLLAALQIRLPLLYRVPYHLMLALFFGYPLLVARLAEDPHDPLLDWCLLGFAVAAGLVLAALVPAAARGAAYVERNGTPWRWAWYPWTVFGMMGLAACGRCFYICVAFHWLGIGTIFAPYFLVPILLAGCLLWLEIARASRRGGALQGALAAAAALPLLALPHYGAGTEQALFADKLTEVAATPLFLTLSAVAALFAYAAWRRVRCASGWLTAALLALVPVGPTTSGWGDFAAPQAWPLLLLGLVHLVLFVRTARVAYGVVCSLTSVAAATLLMRGTWYTAHAGFIPVQQAAAVLLLFGLARYDPFARPLRTLAAALLLASALLAACAPQAVVPWDPAAGATYLVLLSAVAWAYWYRVRGGLYFWLGAGTLGSGGAMALDQLYRIVKRSLPTVDYLLWGALFFLLGLFVSALKAGLAAKLRARWHAPDAHPP